MFFSKQQPCQTPKKLYQSNKNSMLKDFAGLNRAAPARFPASNRTKPSTPARQGA
jgi:hypothetical protein